MGRKGERQQNVPPLKWRTADVAARALPAGLSGAAAAWRWGRWRRANAGGRKAGRVVDEEKHLPAGMEQKQRRGMGRGGMPTEVSGGAAYSWISPTMGPQHTAAGSHRPLSTPAATIAMIPAAITGSDATPCSALMSLHLSSSCQCATAAAVAAPRPLPHCSPLQ